MGQKVNPHGLRVGIIKDWDSDGMQRSNLQITWLKIVVRKYVRKKLYNQGISESKIRETSNK